MPMTSAEDAALQSGVAGQLVAEHGHLTERAVDEVLSQLRIVVEHEAEDRDEHEEQGEDAEERVVRDRGRETGPVVLPEPLVDGERHGQPAVPLLDGVGADDESLEDVRSPSTAASAGCGGAGAVSATSLTDVRPASTEDLYHGRWT